MIRRTLGRELFSWLFSSLLVVFYLQPRVASGPFPSITRRIE